MLEPKENDSTRENLDEEMRSQAPEGGEYHVAHVY